MHISTITSHHINCEASIGKNPSGAGNIFQKRPKMENSGYNFIRIALLVANFKPIFWQPHKLAVLFILQGEPKLDKSKTIELCL